MSETKARYYSARVDFLRGLLAGHLTPKQRRQAEQELQIANVNRLRAQKRPHETFPSLPNPQDKGSEPSSSIVPGDRHG